MLCCFGSAERKQHQRNTRQTASQIDPLVLPADTLTIEITPDTVPPPTPALAPPRTSTRRPPSPTDPILPDARPSESSSHRSRRRPATADTYPPPPNMSPRSGRAPPPAEQGPRVISYHRPGATSGSSARRPGSARSPPSNKTYSQTTNSTTTATVASGGRVLQGASLDEKRPARRQASSPHLGARARDRPPTAPSSNSAPVPAPVHHARSFSSLGSAASRLPFTTPSLPPVVPTSPLLGPADWPHMPSPVIRPSTSPIVVHRAATSTRAPHIDLLTGTVLRAGRDPPPRYEAG